MTVTSNLTSGTAMTMSDLQAADDTVLQFGSGDSAFTVSRSSQSISDVITGVTINTTAQSVGKTVTVSVNRDTTDVASALNNFISQYNNYTDYVANQNQYDASTKATGTLFGEYTLLAAQSDTNNNCLLYTSPSPRDQA
eukprot:TRINITY_DN21221_c0_g1_i1.p2 TRINITY_DN21221_c0_g1~~TRINITY_DN21221_c0_g1_i1.p2  ORF type:complete len:139 (+),score=4.84 TRINITY_DN21221_c0_g1_i1:149-565(+)